MKWVTVVLAAAAVWFQYSLWIGKGSLHDMGRIEEQLATQEEKNRSLTLHNNALQAEVTDLATGQEAIAEIARVELGYIQDGETYYRFIGSR